MAKIAALYIATQGFFWLVRKDADYYGESWWYLVAAVELITALSMLGIKHWAARWIMWVSLSAVAINLGCTSKTSFLFDYYEYIIPCSEYARALAIIIASNIVWQPLSQWYLSRQNRKRETWLAQTIQTFG